MKKLILSISSFMLLLFASAQSSSANTDEQTIRNLIAQENEGKNVIQSTDSIVFVAGPFPRPLVGKMNPERQAISDSISKVRSNSTYKREVVRLVVAKSGDIAYEFGNGVINYVNPQKEPVVVNNSYVRTWKKVNGQWMVDIAFYRPNR